MSGEGLPCAKGIPFPSPADYTGSMTTEFSARVERAVAGIRRVSQAKPKIGIILGSGLSNLAASFGGQTISYRDIPGFPEPTVAGHVGMLYLGEEVVVLAGRFHFYEGHSMDTVALPTAVLAALGVRTLILTNAAGGVHHSVHPGDLVLISDHITVPRTTPLSGPHRAGFAPRFSDMPNVYTPANPEKAKRFDPLLKEGVYMAFTGPCYESPAEVRAARALGADLVGMSTVPEAIMARSLGLEVMGVSVVTNLAAGISPVPLDHAEVTAMGKQAEGRLGKLLKAMV